MRTKFLQLVLASMAWVIITSTFVKAQCYYIASTSTSTDSLTYTFSGGTFASYGCSPIDPTFWLNGNCCSVTVHFTHPEDYPTFRVWGMNDDDSASVTVNGEAYPLNAASATYTPKVLCGISPGPDGVIFANGKMVGANNNSLGNYSYQDVMILKENVSSFTVATVSGAGWGFAGVSVDCSPPALAADNDRTLAGIKLFPNPSSGIIEIQGKPNERYEVTIINDLGMIMKREIMTGSTIDLTGFIPGLYSVLIQAGDQVVTRRVIRY